MATSSTRVLWKGAISLGLVHIPVRLHSAVEESRNMRLIDQKTMSPVGHKNISKATGEPVAQSDIVKGLEVDGGRYVLLTPQEIREALPKSTQTIELAAFVQQDQVPLMFFSKPYYVSPAAKGAKPFALLRDVLRRRGDRTFRANWCAFLANPLQVRLAAVLIDRNTGRLGPITERRTLGPPHPLDVGHVNLRPSLRWPGGPVEPPVRLRPEPVFSSSPKLTSRQ